MADSANPQVPALSDGGQGQQSTSSTGTLKPSLVLEPNSGCLKLNPILSWNYSSVLPDSYYWYESWNFSNQGTLRKGNKHQKASIDPSKFIADDNICGLPSAVSIGGTRGTGESIASVFQNQVFGLGGTRNFSDSGSFVDNESAVTIHHAENIFVPTNIPNAWREIQSTEFAQFNAVSGNSSNVPKTLIRSNLSYFKCGQDPNTISAPLTQWANTTQNLGNEYILTSLHPIPENCSFAIAFNVFSHYKESGNNGLFGEAYFRVYFGGKYLFQYNGEQAAFCPDTSDSNPDNWDMIPVTGLKLSNKGNATGKHSLIVLVFEPVGRHLVISNELDNPDPNSQGERPSWAYIDWENYTATDMFNIPECNLVVGVRAMDVAFSYVPVVYPTSGTLTVSNVHTDYAIDGLEFHDNPHTNTCSVMDGKIEVPINIVDSTQGIFGYTIFLQRGDAPDKTPALYAIELRSPPDYTNIGTREILTDNRVRKVNLAMGVQQTTGTLVLDDRDGAMADAYGYLAVSISVGWAGDQTLGPKLVFNGIAAPRNAVKSSNQSYMEFSLLGRDIILRDAIAFNLPIYDGMLADEAITDLLNRGGWGNYPANVNSGGYQLSIPSDLTAPTYFFPMGRSIWDCIQDIAKHAGCWAYVDNLGQFNFIKMNNGFNVVATYKEVPGDIGSYDEWRTLSGYRNMSEVRNATLVVGLNEFAQPIIAVRKDDAGSVGSFADSTSVPWLRWIVYQDARLNTPEACQLVSEHLYQNNTRIQAMVEGQVWGNPQLVPWLAISLNLKTDDVGIPSSNVWRIVTANHALDGDTGDYVVNLECEYVDPRYQFIGVTGD